MGELAEGGPAEKKGKCVTVRAVGPLSVYSQEGGYVADGIDIGNDGLDHLIANVVGGGITDGSRDGAMLNRTFPRCELELRIWLGGQA